jgi:hypothetical protein
VIALPPSSAGAVHDTVTSPLPATPDTPDGDPGMATSGVTGADAPDEDESPTALVATTVNVYGVPLVRPDTTHEVAPVVVHV